MNGSEIQLNLTVSEAGLSDERLDEMTNQLIRDLRELGTQSVERAPGGDLPEGAKGDPVTLGALLLVVLPPLLPPLVEFMQAWSLRGNSRQVKIKAGELEIEFTPDGKLDQSELLAMVEKLRGISQAQA